MPLKEELKPKEITKTLLLAATLAQTYLWTQHAGFLICYCWVCGTLLWLRIFAWINFLRRHMRDMNALPLMSLLKKWCVCVKAYPTTRDVMTFMKANRDFCELTDAASSCLVKGKLWVGTSSLWQKVKEGCDWEKYALSWDGGESGSNSVIIIIILTRAEIVEQLINLLIDIQVICNYFDNWLSVEVICSFQNVH